MFADLSDELKSDIDNLIKKYKNLKINEDNEFSEIINEEEFKKKIRRGYNYPTYPNRKDGKNLLIHVRNYLLNKKLNKKNALYPRYITENNNINIDNEKKYFRNIAANYELDRNNNLCM